MLGLFSFVFPLGVSFPGKEFRGFPSAPSWAEEKTGIGHWEGDAVEGKGHGGGLATLVERESEFLIMGKVADKSSEAMKNMMIGRENH